MRAEAATMLDSSLAPSSRKVYSRAWQIFQSFHQKAFGKAGTWPIPESKVAMFIAYMNRECFSNTTIRTYLTALSYPHKVAGFQDPTSKFWIKKIAEVAGANAEPKISRKPITLAILERLLETAKTAFTPYEACLMRAVFGITFHACARVGEMVTSNGQDQHAILAQHAQIKGDKVIISFVSFKHHKGNTPEVRVLHGLGQGVLPSTLLKEYAHIRPGTWKGPLFIWRSGEQVTAREVRLGLQRCLKLSGVDPSGLSPHSFRIGAVSEAAGRGASEAQLRTMGRWRSNAYIGYTKPLQSMPSYVSKN